MASGLAEAGLDHSPKTVVLELSPDVEVSAGTQAIQAQPGNQTTEESRSTVPEGKGPLYKCSICGEFVYESQLEYHVTVCPDPKDGSPPLSTPDAKAEPEAAWQEPAEVSLEAFDDAVLRQSLEASEAQKKMWKEWKDSKLAEHHDAMLQRSSAKRNQLLDELRKKEAQECTFQPKTLPRGSPRTFPRPDTTGEGKWVQRLDQRMRSQRLKQVEAQHYAELTLKPKISPYAQAWSQKQAEAGADVSVFERLYQAYLRQEEKNAKRDRDSEVESHSPKTSPRRIPTSELLYSDALDRRERLRIMAEQMQIRRVEESKERCAVLNKSRRYYWQMLEKQIRGAFESAAQGPLLPQASLEDFLVGFKCMKPRRTGEGEDLESARLQVALWRHLDPGKTGFTDILTMTLFFHVLMGAVDDAVQEAARSNAEDTNASPAKSASEGASLLQSIHEEGPEQAAGTAAAGRSSDGGRSRVIELLLRFDPVRLRCEFQSLLLHRMHYQAQQAKPEKKSDLLVTPSIDSHSKKLAEKLLEKQKGESGTATHEELLLWRQTQAKARKESMRKQRLHEEVSSCTFRPNCIATVRKDDVEILTPAGSTRTEVLYSRGLADKERRQAKVLEGEKAKTTAEVRGCTFQPNLCKSVKSYHKVHEASAQVPRGFYETRQRMRAANEMRERVKQQREDRMARIQATSPYQASGAASTPATAEVRAGRSPGASPGPEDRVRRSSPKSQPRRQRSAGHATARERREGPTAQRLSYTPPRSSSLPPEAKEPEDEREGMGGAPAEGAPDNAEGNAEELPDDQPMLYVDVNITPGQPPKRIILFQGQSISEVAADFAAKHMLTPALAQKLHALLREVALKQELRTK